MQISSAETNRLGIFFFFDKDGIVDNYVEALISDMRENLSELIIVVNGKLTTEGHQIFDKYASNIMVRENKGLDVWAYKTAMASYGWSELSKFDEIVLFNSTIMGPIYPFKEMFDEMSQRDVDFWGINWFHKVEGDPFGTTPDGYIPQHIQSHFHAYRRSFVSSEAFQSYWDNLPPIATYTESVGQHEAPFTKRFEDLGFKSDVYIDTSDLSNTYYYPLLFCPKQLIKERRCPIFKRRSFFHDYYDLLAQSVGNAGRELYDYLRDETDYDTGLIWQNALRTMHMANIQRALNLTYVLPAEFTAQPAESMKLAIIAHIYYMDLLDQVLGYIQNMPQGCDVIITVGSAEKVAVIQQATEGLPYNVIVRQIENRGRDVSALLVGVRDLLSDYDLICFVHDKKVTQLLPYSKGDGFAVKCFENLLASPQFVNNVIREFQREPNLGMLMPPPPNHAEYFPGYSMSWGPNYDITVDFLKELNISVPISKDVEPISPLGTMFWFRPQAFSQLLSKDWTWEDFPPEPNAIDGTFLHAVERGYGYASQASGYFNAWLLSDSFARTELTNLSFELQELTRAVSSIVPRATLSDTVIMLTGVPGSGLAHLKAFVRAHTPAKFHKPIRRLYHQLRRIFR